MFKTICIILCIILIIGCEQDKPKTLRQAHDVILESPTNEKALVINSFNRIPKSDTLCSCNFSLTKNAYKVGLYIFTTKFDTLSTSYMKINNEWTEYNLNYYHQTSDSLLISSENDSILISLNAQRDSVSLDNFRYKGNFQLQRPQDSVVIFSSNIYGECDF